MPRGETNLEGRARGRRRVWPPRAPCFQRRGGEERGRARLAIQASRKGRKRSEMASDQSHVPRRSRREHERERRGHRDQGKEKVRLVRRPLIAMEPTRSRMNAAIAPIVIHGRNAVSRVRSPCSQVKPARAETAQSEQFVENECDIRPTGASDVRGAGAQLQRPEIIKPERARARESGRAEEALKRSAQRVVVRGIRSSKAPRRSRPGPTAPRSSSSRKARSGRAEKAEPDTRVQGHSSGSCRKRKRQAGGERSEAEENDVRPRFAQVIPEKRIR